MEYGLIPRIDQYSDNKLVEAQKVTTLDNATKTNEQSKLQEIVKKDSNNVEETANVNKTTIQSTANQHEVVLTNTNFGYNESSKDFFVRAVRGSSENQYPTEQMMRIKSFIMSQNT